MLIRTVKGMISNMDLNEISTQLMYTTTPIFTRNVDSSVSTGTGFIFSIEQSGNTSIPLLITNHHVIKDAQIGFVELHLLKDGVPSKDTIRITFDNSIINSNKLGDLDIVALPIAGPLNGLLEKGITPYYKSIDSSIIPSKKQIEELAAIEDITFIGYPNAIYDTTNKIPIIREGITATPIWNDFMGKEQFLIDAGAFPGSSGSPVFIYNRGTYPTKDGIGLGSRILFVGILSGTMRRRDEQGASFLDLGVVINCRSFIRELDIFIKRMTGKSIL